VGVIGFVVVVLLIAIVLGIAVKPLLFLIAIVALLAFFL
jgi:hypothetical protein